MLARITQKTVSAVANTEYIFSFPAAPAKGGLPKDYAKTLETIKRRIHDERLRTVLSANSAMVLLYWDIGCLILERQKASGWGAKIIDRMALDLSKEFPDMRGFSPRNLKYMRAFSAAWPNRLFVQQVAAQIPWFHNCLLLDRVPDAAAREWYIKASIREGWFYHLKLRRYVVIELKAVPFDAAFVGQLNLYLSAVDDLLRHPDDKPTIGLLLCREKKRLVVEYALRNVKTPIGVAKWETRIAKSLPKELRGSLPTVEELEKELGHDE